MSDPERKIACSLCQQHFYKTHVVGTPCSSRPAESDLVGNHGSVLEKLVMRTSTVPCATSSAPRTLCCLGMCVMRRSMCLLNFSQTQTAAEMMKTPTVPLVDGCSCLARGNCLVWHGCRRNRRLRAEARRRQRLSHCRMCSLNRLCHWLSCVAQC